MRPSVWLAPLALIALHGCASVALHNYVGGDLENVVQRYGPPVDHQTLPNGTELFRWAVSASHKPGADKPLDMFLPIGDAPLRRRIAANANGLVFGGVCIYAVRARWQPATRTWRVTGYDPPRVDCD